MKQFLWGFLAVLVVVLGLGLAGSQPAKAAPAEGFNIITSPLPIKLSTSPGKTVETELRMKNQGSQPETIKVGLMKFGATGENGQPNLFDLTPRDTYASWVHFSPQVFVAEPGIWKVVKVTINVPQDAGLGYYLATTFSRASQPGVSEAANLKGSVATLILLDVKNGNENRKLSIISFEATHGVYEYLPTTFKIRLRNEGNIYISPVGNIFIQKSGKTVDTLDFNSGGGSVLPKSNRQFKVLWENGFPVGKDKLVNGKPILLKNGDNKKDLKWDFTQVNKLRIGHYTAKLLVVYDNGSEDVPLEQTLSFWIFPWKIILVATVVVGLIGYVLYSFLRSTVGKTKGRIGKKPRGKK